MKEKIENRLCSESFLLEDGETMAVCLETVLEVLDEQKEDLIGSTRYYIWEKNNTNRTIQRWGKFIKNPYTGGDDDFIVFDSYRGEWTYGEDGELPLCDQDLLNSKYYINKSLQEIINNVGKRG